MRILVVDDSRISRRALIRLLRGQPDLEVSEAEDGSKAVEAWLTGPYDLVFMDLTMPIMTGYEACRTICEHDPSANIAIVSADIQPKARERCRDAGARAFVGKPIARSQVLELVQGARERMAC